MQEPTSSFYSSENNAVPGPSYQPLPAAAAVVPMFVQPSPSNGGSQNGDAGKGNGKPVKKKAARGQSFRLQRL